MFLFSDNVSLADEIELKRLAVARQLLCMGPDCGTAYTRTAIGLGFAERRARAAASDASPRRARVCRPWPLLLAALGEGVSHGIGVGGRDLSVEVGGAMTLLALEALAGDASTEAIVVISEAAGAEVLSAHRDRGACRRQARGRLRARRDGAAGRARHLVVDTRGRRGGGQSRPCAAARWTPRTFSDPAAVRARLDALSAREGSRRGGLLGLFTGGTLAHEARLILEPLIGPIAGNVGATGRRPAPNPRSGR